MNSCNCRRTFCALTALAVGLAATTARAAVVYEQLTDGSNNGFFSDGNQGINFYDNRIADNFTLASGTSITQIHWWGGSENFISPDILFNANAFVISFYNNDANNLPIEPPIYTETIPVANITATLTGNSNLAGGLEYLFVANLGAPVALAGGTSYSLHIGALLNAPGDDAFAWHTADADNIFSGDGLGPANDGIWEPQTLDDMAFRLLNGEEGGRCCLPTGDCIIDDETDCTTAGGTFGGDNSTCGNGSICRGRCCDPSGFCETTGPVDCIAPAVFAGLGTNCNDPDICRGRCCTPNGDCTLTGPAGCVAPSTFGGLGTDCSPYTGFGNPNPPTVNIPDAGAAPPSVITVASNFSIQDLDVRVKIQHTFRGDLILCLTAPGGGPTVQLSTGTGCLAGGDCGGEDNLNAIYDDEGAPINCLSANLGNVNATPDSVIPGTSLATFDGLPSAGDWTLAIFDQFGGDQGVLLEWELLFFTGSPCQGACCAANGSCAITGELPCQQGGGTFQGASTACSPSPCAPNGACCTEALCSIQGQLDCTAAGGVWGGLNSTCTSPIPCQASCCKPDGSCDLRTIASCTAIEGGFPGALGSSCPVGSCRGRCCLANGNCSVIPVESCAGVASPGVLNCDAVQVFQFDGVNMIMADVPDGVLSQNFQTVETNGPLIITDLDVDLSAIHTWPGDVQITIEHLGTSVIIYDRPGNPFSTFGCATDDFNIILDDEGTGGTIEDTCNLATPSALSPPNFTPNNPLSAFDGLDAAGEWTLTSRDFFTAGDTGTLLSWSLHVGFNGQACPVGGCTCFGDMNGDSTVNGADIKSFANCVAAGGAGCPCGDMNHVGGATSADVTLFVNAVITSTCGTP